MVVVKKLQLITPDAPDTFDFPKGLDGETQIGMWPRYDASKWVISRSVQYLGIRPYHLHKLLGTRHSAYVYWWLKGKVRPGAMYLVRLLYLWDLRQAGLDFTYWGSIDWSTGTVTMRNKTQRALAEFWRKQDHVNGNTPLAAVG